VIGRTPLTICDIREDPATSYRPGDRVQFQVIPERDWAQLEGRFLRPAPVQEGGVDGSGA
jgi:allophanate hydrolase subunit 1